MQFTLAALYVLFETKYLTRLGTLDSYLAKHPEETKDVYFRKRTNGEYSMSGVQEGWLCFRMGVETAGGEVIE